jgi:uncharacterized membrane protein
LRDPSTEIFQFVIRDPPAREPTQELAPVPADESGERPADSGSGRCEDSGYARSRAPTRTDRPLHLASRGGRRPLPPATWDRRSTQSTRALRDGPVVAAGLLIGVGLAGFVDVALFHQLTADPGAAVDAVSRRTLEVWGGLLQACTWLALVIGVGVLWRVAQVDGVAGRTSTFVGAILLGWGFLSGIEGVVDLQVLALHDVRPGHAHALVDGGFIASGLVLMLIGTLCVRAGRR